MSRKSSAYKYKDTVYKNEKVKSETFIEHMNIHKLGSWKLKELTRSVFSRPIYCFLVHIPGLDTLILGSEKQFLFISKFIIYFRIYSYPNLRNVLAT